MSEIKQTKKSILQNIIEVYLQKTNSKLTTNEMKEFVMLCQAYKLNPLKNEIFAIKYGTKFSIVVSYQEYLKRADKTGLLDYVNVEIENDDKGVPTIGYFYGKRKDQSKEMKIKLLFKEWNLGTPIWSTKPFFMFEKCILAVGLRRLFPNEIATMPYIKEEVQGEEVIDSKKIEATTPEIESQKIEQLLKDE